MESLVLPPDWPFPLWRVKAKPASRQKNRNLGDLVGALDGQDPEEILSATARARELLAVRS